MQMICMYQQFLLLLSKNRKFAYVLFVKVKLVVVGISYRPTVIYTMIRHGYLYNLDMVIHLSINNLFNCTFHFSKLHSQVQGLTPSGCTALGPALAVCCGLVAATPRSEVILCTDGQPNTGVGSLNGGAIDFDSGFYAKVCVTSSVRF